MLKRILSSVFLVWYAILATGFQVHVHYCCGNVSGISINEIALEDTTCCDSHHDACSLEHGCCSSDDIYVALEDDHKTASFEIELFGQASVTHTATLLEAIVLDLRDDHYSSPESRRGPPLYRLFSSPLHYG